MVENISLPPEVEKAIDKRSSMAAIGNLNDYVKLQMADAIGSGDGAGGGVAGTAAQFGAGLAMGQQMLHALQAPTQTPAAAPPPPLPGGATASGLPELLTPAEVAGALGVTEADVMASLEAGDLKGKKIGASWRVTRAALNDFLKS